MRKPKILIVVSGQTRRINEHNFHERFLDSIHRCFPEEKYLVNIVGHTWDDQPLPDNMDPYAKIIQTSQNDIVDWVMDFPGKRIACREAWIEQPEFQELKKDPTAYWNHLMEVAKGTYGQVWSFWESMQLAKTYTKSITYDAVIKWRWDTGLMPVHNNITDEEFQEQCEYHNKLFDDFIKARGHWGYLTFGDMGVCGTTTVLSTIRDKTNYIPDHVFWFRPHTIDLFLENSVGEILDRICQKSAGTPPSGHTLWAEYLWQCEVEMMPVFPDIFSCFYSADKPNKDWGI